MSKNVFNAEIVCGATQPTQAETWFCIFPYLILCFQRSEWKLKVQVDLNVMEMNSHEVYCFCTWSKYKNGSL